MLLQNEDFLYFHLFLLFLLFLLYRTFSTACQDARLFFETLLQYKSLSNTVNILFNYIYVRDHRLCVIKYLYFIQLAYSNDLIVTRKT